MNPPGGDLPRARSALARIGIAALNLIGPGIGLLRVGQLRLALIFAGLYLALAAFFSLLLNALPVMSFVALATTALCFAICSLAMLVASIVLTWKHSRERYRAWRSGRWYAIVGAIMFGFAITSMLQLAIQRAYRSFYATAESMMPTFMKHDHLVADMRWRTPEIGNVVLVRAPKEEIRIYRVAAVGGQVFAMRDGVPIIDGRPALQRPAGTMTIAARYIPAREVKRIAEHLPGEQGSHIILDAWPQEFDNVAPVRIPSGHMMVLGDNRDMAADGRIPLALGGVELLPTSAIIGRPLYITYGSSRPIGTRADH